MIYYYLTLVFAFTFVFVQADVKTNYTTTKTDPTKISIPDLPQTTSTDVATECTYYNSEYTVNPAEWPTIWDIATSNNMNTSQEFQDLYNSIDWATAPNVAVRKSSPTGGLDMTGYDTANDPDCWWSSSQCTKPKHQGCNADIVSCPEPGTWGLVSILLLLMLSYFLLV